MNRIYLIVVWLIVLVMAALFVTNYVKTASAMSEPLDKPVSYPETNPVCIALETGTYAEYLDRMAAAGADLGKVKATVVETVERECPEHSAAVSATRR